MGEIARIEGAEAVIFGVLKISWEDGYENIVDVRPYLEEVSAADFIRQEPILFHNVKIGDFGHGLEWVAPDGSELMFGTASLRKRAERQAALHKLAS